MLIELLGSSKLVAEFFEYSINTILWVWKTAGKSEDGGKRLTFGRFQRGVYPAEDFTPWVRKRTQAQAKAKRYSVKKYGLNMLGRTIVPIAREKLTFASLLGWSSQGVHQENHVAAEQVDGGRQDFQTSGGYHQQRDWRTRWAVAIRCSDHEQVVKTPSVQESSR